MILSIPAPFPFVNGVIKVLEPPGTDQRTVLERLLGGRYDKPYVVDDGAARALYFSFDFVQSAMRLSQPNALELPYSRTMMGFLLFQPPPAKILMLGLGGGSLAKFCHQHLPAAKITVVEINPHVVAFRNEFKIPLDSERFAVVLADAAEYVAACRSRYDVIICDAFDHSGFAGALSQPGFYPALRRLLAGHGLLVVNMAGPRPGKLAHLKMLSQVFEQRTLAVPVAHDDNHVLLAFNDPAFVPDWAAVHRRAAALSRSLGLEFEKFARKFERSQRLEYAKRALRSFVGGWPEAG
ncbi:MAG: Polyamine aminopropyltransferase [Proteobacteria bacterium]|nr:Polyamine aminopropyltransferase [Pseudomonadota bacterium]